MAAFRRSLGTLPVDMRSLDGINTDQHLFAVVSCVRGNVEGLRNCTHTHTQAE